MLRNGSTGDSGAVSLSLGFVIGWQAKPAAKEEIAPCSCACHCGCKCEAALSGSLLLGFGIVLIVILGVGALLFLNRPLATVETEPNPAKGKKGVFGQTGKVLSLTPTL